MSRNLAAELDAARKEVAMLEELLDLRTKAQALADQIEALPKVPAVPQIVPMPYPVPAFPYPYVVPQPYVIPQTVPIRWTVTCRTNTDYSDGGNGAGVSLVIPPTKPVGSIGAFFGNSIARLGAHS